MVRVVGHLGSSDCLFDGHHDRFLHEVSGVDSRVCKQFLAALDVQESFDVLLWPHIGLQVRVFKTLVDAMANLFAALASLIPQLFKPFLFYLFRVFELLFCVG